MLKLSGIFLALCVSFTLFSSEGTPCTEKNNCSVQMVETLHNKSITLTLEIRSSYNRRAELTDEEHQELESKLALFQKLNNEIQACEKILKRPRKERVPLCSLTVRSQNKLSENLNMIKVTHQIGTLNGQCQARKTSNQKSIENLSGERLAYGFKDRWKLSQGVACKTPGGEVTDRNIQFGGYSKKHKRNGYIFIMDLSYDNQYPNSTFRAKRANLKKSKMSISENEKGLEFKWDNDASITIDITTGEVLESTILSDSTINPKQCVTKKYFSRRRARMIPSISLKKKFKHIKVTSPRNI